jgi:hypothetical protein
MEAARANHGVFSALEPHLNLERAVQTLRASGTVVPDELLQHLSP